MILGLDARRGHRVLSDLQKYVPDSQSAEWARSGFSKKLKGSDGIYEFIWPTRGGGTPRVLWFFDADRVVVCCLGEDKKGALSDGAIRSAEKIKAEYLAAKQSGEVEFIDFSDFDKDDV
jgi:hypothetical protein